MKFARLVCVFLGLILACCALGSAQEQGVWRASSSSARSVTGDVSLGDAQLLVNFYNFPIVRARDLEPGELSAVFDVDSNSRVKGHLYRLNVPAAKKFLHKSTLCGAEDTHWMAAYAEGNTLHLAFFSSEKVPTFTIDAISNSSSMCGTYDYVR